MLNAVEGLRIGSHRIQPTVLVAPPAHPRKKSLQEGKLGIGRDVCDLLGLEFLCDCFAEKLSFENLCARPVLYEGHTVLLHVDEER